MLRKVVVLLLICLSFSTTSAQTTEAFVKDNFVLITAPRLQVYTEIDNQDSVAAEMLRGMRSRILDIRAGDDGIQWVYLENLAYGWVPTVIDGESTMMLYSDKAIREMLQSAEDAVANRADVADSYVWRAAVYMTLGLDAEQVIEDFSTALALDPQDFALIEYRGRAYFDTNQWGLALADLEMAIAFGRQLANTYNRAGIAYEGLDEYDRAIDYFELGIEVQPNYGILTGNIGNQYYYTRDYDTAIDYYEQALLIDPHLSYLYASIGLIYKNSGDYEQALRQFNLGISADSSCYECLFRRGSLYLEVYGDAEAAMDDFTVAIRIDPYDERAFNELGLAQLQTGNYDEAIDSLKTASELNPSNDLTLYNLAAAYSYRGDYAEALNAYNRVVDLNDDHAHATLLYRAQIKVALEDYEGAIDDIERFIRGTDDDADNMYFIATAHIIAAAAYANMGDYEEAQENLEQALDTSIEFAQLYTRYGTGYWVTPLRLDEGLELLGQFEASAADNQDADTALQIANILLEYGYWELAQSYYEQYVDLSDDVSDELLDFIEFLPDMYE